MIFIPKVALGLFLHEVQLEVLEFVRLLVLLAHAPTLNRIQFGGKIARRRERDEEEG